jgi:hypothetical protein
MSKARLTFVAATTAALAAATTLAAAPASSIAAPASDDQPGQARSSSYLPNEREKAQNARLQKTLDAALKQAAADKAAGKTSAVAAVTVYYDDSNAPSFDSLIDQGAAVFLCGDGLRMAPAVRETLARIHQEATGCSQAEAAGWLLALERAGRFVPDVFGA